MSSFKTKIKSNSNDNDKSNKKMTMSIICVFCFIVMVWVVYPLFKKNKIKSKRNRSKEDNIDILGAEGTEISIVISRYAENLTWVTALCKKSERLKPTIYNKGDEISCSYTQLLLPNIGKNDHTYLYHIVHNYEKLAPVTIFCPGSSFDDSDKSEMLSFIVDKVLKTSDTVMVGKIYDIPVKQMLFNYQLDFYDTSNKQNMAKSGYLPLIKSTIRPFSKWYDTMFCEKNDNWNDVHLACYYSIFAVSARDIKKRTLSFYENLLSQFTHPNMEVGQYIERSWAAIFKPDTSCQFNRTYSPVIEQFIKSTQFLNKT